MNNLDVQQYFGLKRDPFSMNVTRKDVFKSKAFEARQAQVLAWAAAGDICCVYGDHGSGKTTLLANAMQEGISMDPRIDLIPLGHPDRERMTVGSCLYDTFRNYYADLGVTIKNVPRTAQSRIYWLTKFLIDTLGDRRVAVVIDEAHRLPGPFLKGMKEITDRSFGLRASLMGVVLVGASTTKNHIEQHAKDIYIRLKVGDKFIHCDHYTPDEVGGYLKHRFRRAGNADVFSRQAISAIASICNSPMDIATEAWYAMRQAYNVGDTVVRPNHVMMGFTVKEKRACLKITNAEIARLSNYSEPTVSQFLKDGYNGKNDDVAADVDATLTRLLAEGNTPLNTAAVAKIRMQKAS